MMYGTWSIGAATQGICTTRALRGCINTLIPVRHVHTITDGCFFRFDTKGERYRTRHEKKKTDPAWLFLLWERLRSTLLIHYL